MKQLYSLKYLGVWCDKLCSSAFGNYLLLISLPLKLCQVGWGQMHIFRFLQRYLVVFKLRLRLGHSRTFTDLPVSHSCCVLWKVNLLPSLRFWMLWTGFSLKLSQYFGALSFYSTLTSPSVPAAEKQPQCPIAWSCYQHTLLWDVTLPGAWFPSNMMLRIEVHQTKESCFSQSEGPLGASLRIPRVFFLGVIRLIGHRVGLCIGKNLAIRYVSIQQLR